MLEMGQSMNEKDEICVFVVIERRIDLTKRSSE